MLEPTGWLFLGLLVAGFAGLLYWLVKARNLMLRLVSGALAFAISAFFGAALVNQNYQYYTTWGSLFADMGGSGTVAYQHAMAPAGVRPASHTDQSSRPDRPAPVSAPPSPLLSGAPTTDGPPSVTIARIGLSAARTTGTGRVVRLDLPGAVSGITRGAFVYLPPQYFQPAFAKTHFPVLELLHGDPGAASGWIYGLGLAAVMDREIDAGRIGPMVVVMPSTFSGKHGQDCVDAPNGQLDDTYLSTDVPADMTTDFRVSPLGLHWGIGGLSDGGFCAADLALRHPGDYGVVTSMDGFYSSQADLAVLGKIFGTDAAALRANDPTLLALDDPQPLPRFWIMSGTGNSVDSLAAGYFRDAVTRREPIEYVVVRGGRHTPAAWRAVLPSMLRWSWDALSGGPVGVGTAQFGVSEQPPGGGSSGPARPSGPQLPAPPPRVPSGSPRPSATPSV